MITKFAISVSHATCLPKRLGAKLIKANSTAFSSLIMVLFYPISRRPIFMKKFALIQNKGCTYMI